MDPDRRGGTEMTRLDVKGATYVAIRFSNGDRYAVGPVEMDRAGRVLFRVVTPKGDGMCSHARIVLEGLSAAGHEIMRTALIAGLSRGGEIGVATTLDEALGALATT
jgi:hypothetical protein